MDYEAEHDLVEIPDVRQTGSIIRANLHFPRFNYSLMYDPIQELSEEEDDNSDSAFDTMNADDGATVEVSSASAAIVATIAIVLTSFILTFI